jgi:predicted membrane protein
METRRSVRLSPQLVMGVIVILLGIIFFAHNLGLLEAEDYLKYWPALLVVYGISRFVQCNTVPARLWASAFIVVGSVMLLNRIGILHFYLWDYWPLILVLIGSGMIWGNLTRGKSVDGATRNALSDGLTTINAFALMGGYRRSSNSQDFRGGELTAIMGGVEVDLRQASIKQGEAVIDIFAFWGGVELRVPDDWMVVIEGVPIMGGYEDKTHVPKSDTGKRLIIRGYVLMGGAEIKN